ncbi:hypothetical protein ABFX02_11G039000 [Erythranthe guttata]
MRYNWKLVSLLLLSLLILETQGIRLLKETPLEKHHNNKIQNDEINGKRKEEKMSVKSSPTTTTEKRQPEMYPDILDIAGMDYSQARRKPPIHN